VTRRHRWSKYYRNPAKSRKVRKRVRRSERKNKKRREKKKKKKGQGTKNKDGWDSTTPSFSIDTCASKK
jgi:hypothetical protein